MDCYLWQTYYNSTAESGAKNTKTLKDTFVTLLLPQAAYDTSKGKLVKNNFALGFSTPDFVLHSNVNDGSIFGASLYQKVQNAEDMFKHLNTATLNV